MAQQGKIEFSFWYSLAKWHRTVDRQPAAMRTCLKTAGKGNSTYCLQTWTHMSENAQNIAFFTRFVGAESAGLSKKNNHFDPYESTIRQSVAALPLPERTRDLANILTKLWLSPWDFGIYEGFMEDTMKLPYFVGEIGWNYHILLGCNQQSG